MDRHWHTGIDAVLFAGVSAIVVIQVVRLSAAALVKRDGALGTIGKALGAVVTF